MIKKDNQQLIEEFYHKIKEKYPELTKEQVTLNCMTPFQYVKREMESGELPTIRLKHFGTFLVYPKRATSLLRKLVQDFKDLKVEARMYFSKKEMLEKFIKKHE